MFLQSVQKANHQRLFVLNDDGDIVAWAAKGPNMGAWWILRSHTLCWTDPGARDISKVHRNNFGLPAFLSNYEDDPTTLLIKGRRNARIALQQLARQGMT